MIERKRYNKNLKIFEYEIKNKHWRFFRDNKRNFIAVVIEDNVRWKRLYYTPMAVLWKFDILAPLIISEKIWEKHEQKEKNGIEIMYLSIVEYELEWESIKI